MPTHDRGMETRQDPIRLKNLLSQAVEKLTAAGEPKDDATRRLQPISDFVDDTGFWQNQQRGLVLYLSDSELRVYQLPRTVDELVHLSDRFYVKPLFRLLRDGSCWVLGFSQNAVRLMRLTPWGTEEVEVPDAPANFAEATRLDDPEKSVQMHTETPPAGPDGSRPAMYHGQGTGTDDAREKRRLTEYAHMVECAVTDLIEHEPTPLILAGAEPLVSIYRDVTSYPKLADGHIACKPELIEPAEFHEQAMAFAEPVLEADRRQAAERFREAQGSSRGSDDLADVLQAASRGQVELLFVNADEHRWGRYDPGVGSVDIHDERVEGDEDLLDVAAAEAFNHGGDVVVVGRDEVPADAPVAAVYRYATPTS